MIAAVVVLFHPNRENIRTLVDRLSPQVSTIYLMDNTFPADTDFEVFLSNIQSPSVRYKKLGKNGGIAWAQNQGVTWAESEGHDHVVFFDQDSLPDSKMISYLQSAMDELVAKGRRVAAVGPTWLDIKTKRYASAIVTNPFKASRTPVTPESKEFLKVDILISSGSLVAIEAFKKIGPINEDIFIDGADVEWSLRAKHLGFESYLIPQAVLQHSMGDHVVKVGGRSLILHSPIRNYYNIRNTCYLLTQGHIDVFWKIKKIVTIVPYIILLSWFSEERCLNLRIMITAVCHGMRGRLGVAPGAVKDTLKT